MNMMLKTLVCLALLAVQAGAQDAAPPATERDRLSYGLGVDMGRKFKKQELDINPEMVLKGLRDGWSGGKLLLTEAELRTVMANLQSQLRKKLVLEKRKVAGDNNQKGSRFLAGNREKEGVVTLPSGVQYKILKKGEGKVPTDRDTVECYYRATLVDGALFDSTEPEKPASLKVGDVVPGLREALKLMAVGSAWQIFIPNQLAHEERDAGSEAGSNEVLIYEVELLGIK